MFFLFAAFFADARAALTPVYPAVLNAGSREKAFASLELFFKTYDTAVLKRLKKPVIITDEPARLSRSGYYLYASEKCPADALAYGDQPGGL